MYRNGKCKWIAHQKIHRWFGTRIKFDKLSQLQKWNEKKCGVSPARLAARHVRLWVIHSNGKLNFCVWVKASITIMWSMAVCSIIFSDKRFTNWTMKYERFRCVSVRCACVCGLRARVVRPRRNPNYFRFCFAGSIGGDGGGGALGVTKLRNAFKYPPMHCVCRAKHCLS